MQANLSEPVLIPEETLEEKKQRLAKELSEVIKAAVDEMTKPAAQPVPPPPRPSRSVPKSFQERRKALLSERIYVSSGSSDYDFDISEDKPAGASDSSSSSSSSSSSTESSSETD